MQAARRQDAEPWKKSGLFGVQVIGRIGLIALIGAEIAAISLGLMLERNLSRDYAVAVASLAKTEEALSAALLYSALFQGMFTAPAIALAVVYYSHKVVGPMYRLTRTFCAARDGEIERETRLRPGDQLWPLTQDLNLMERRIGERLLDLQAALERTGESLRRYDAVSGEYREQARVDLLKHIGGIKALLAPEEPGP